MEFQLTFWLSIYFFLLIFFLCAFCQVDATVSGVCVEHGLRFYTGQRAGGGATDLWQYPENNISICEVCSCF